MSRRLGNTLIACMVALAPICGMAAMYEADITVYHEGGTDEHAFRFNSIQEVIDTFSDEFLEENFAHYSLDDSAEGTLKLRGLNASFQYNMASTTSNDNDANDLSSLTLYIQGVGTEVFYGDDKSDIDDEVIAWFKGQGGDGALLTKIYQAMVSQTPYDPIAGNPNSLMADMITLAYTSGQYINATDIGSSHLFGIGGHYSHTGGSNPIQSATLPLSYVYSFSSGHRMLLVDMPISLYDYDHSISYSGEISLGLKNIINRYWSLTPSAAVGGLGSADMGSVSLIYSGFLNSTVDIPLNHWTMSLYNMGGYLHTGDLAFEGYHIAYDLSNWALNNGAGMHYAFYHALTGVRYTYTNMLGSEWYNNHYQTISLDLASRKHTDTLNYSPLSLTCSYTFTNTHENIYSANFNYVF